MTKEIRNNIKLVFAALVTAMAIVGVIHAFTFEAKTADAFENGYNQAILDANVVSMEENEYVISFHGEEHIYSSTIGKEVMDEASKNGYQQAIEEAVLVSSDKEGYVLSFNGELHSYTFD